MTGLSRYRNQTNTHAHTANTNNSIKKEKSRKTKCVDAKKAVERERAHTHLQVKYSDNVKVIKT